MKYYVIVRSDGNIKQGLNMMCTRSIKACMLYDLIHMKFWTRQNSSLVGEVSMVVIGPVVFTEKSHEGVF
jgi:hypothetical protein